MQGLHYYYDQERCTFIPIPARRIHPLAQAALLITAAFFLAATILLVVDLSNVSPQEAALRAENQMLRRDAQRNAARAEIFQSHLEEIQRRTGTPVDRFALPETNGQRQAGFSLINPSSLNLAARTPRALLASSSSTLYDVEQIISSQNEEYRKLLALAEQRDARTAQMPAIIPADGPIISNYGWRHHPILLEFAMHQGLDILVPTGTPVVATGDGVITEVGVSATYGKYVEIGHPAAGYTTLYAHLSDIPAGIEAGRLVKRRERIGWSGETGRTTGPHLHYEVRDQNGRSIHPLSFIVPHMQPGEYTQMLRGRTQTAFATLERAEGS
jgi:murein DD-endopeptidase MepM/ murein hydrolase activator NlpD